ncbi:MAG TPA: vitamin K epoxide reductase family protein [Thermoplasmata archaeon]|nr:vitamin K epoxide reductase family protein [Thermoplasmata archaeon]
MKTSTLRGTIYLAGLLGLLVAIFAAAEFYAASLRGVCTINQFFSCATVDRSGKTTTFGVQDYLWGVGGFVALLVAAGLAERRPRDVRPAYALTFLATAAVALSGYFLYVQLAEIHALCVVCATAETLGGVVWLASIALAVRTKRKADPPGAPAQKEPPPDPARQAG